MPKRQRTTTELEECNPAKRRRIGSNNEESTPVAEHELLRKRIVELEQELRAKSDALQRAHDHVRCSICKNDMRNPYILECGHTACLKCLRSWFISLRNKCLSHEKEEVISTDDESDNEESSGSHVPRPSVQHPPFVHTALRSGSSVSHSPSSSRLQSQISGHPGREFRSVVHCRKQCPRCKRELRRRPVIDYTLRHIIDAIQLDPLSSMAETERDARWGRQGDVWRGIFIPDSDDDKHIQTPPRRNEPLPLTRAPALTSTPVLPPVPPREAQRRRTERRLQPYPVADAASQIRPRVWRRWEGGNSVGANVSARPRSAVASRLLARHDVLLPPPVREATSEAITSQSLPHLFAPPAPTPGTPASPPNDTAASGPAAETEQPSPATIMEILQILRPQLPSPTRGLNNASSASSQGQSDLKENSDVRERDPQAEEVEEEEEEDENFELIHAMLHGEGSGAGTNSAIDSSAHVERYPVYIEEFERRTQWDGEGNRAGADLED